MMRLAADENFNNHILCGLQGHTTDFDLVRIQDTEIYQADDPTVLEWAAQENRILLTHDIKTMPKYAYERINAQLPMPGLWVIHRDMPIGKVIEELLLMLEASDLSEWENLVTHLPLNP